MLSPFLIAKVNLVCCFLFSLSIGFGQNGKSVFKHFDFQESDSFALTKSLRFYEVLCSRTGFHKFTSSFGLISDRGTEVEMIIYQGPDGQSKKLIRNYVGEDSIRTLCEGGPNKIVFFVSHDNKILWQFGDEGGQGFAPFRFPPKDKPHLTVTKIWVDNDGNIFIGTRSDNFYFIKNGAILSAYDGVFDSSGNFVITKGEKLYKQIVLAHNAGVHSFTQDPINRNIIWIGTNKGLFRFNKSNEEKKNILYTHIINGLHLTVTHLEADRGGNIWFSSMEKGMGFYEARTNTFRFFPYHQKDTYGTHFSIKTFCRKSIDELFVAIRDTLPAIFNTTTGKYTFIQDSIFRKTPDNTTDIKLDGFGNLFVVKGGGLYYTDYYKESKSFSSVQLDSSAYAPFISHIAVSGIPYAEGRNLKGLKSIRLKYHENSLSINFSIAEFVHRENIQFAWMAEGYVNDWVVLPFTGNSNIPAQLNNLSPGRYIFRLKARVGNEDWRPFQTQLYINIMPPVWKTWWFWTSVIAFLSIITFIIVKLREKAVRYQERQKAKHEKELLELEARALRAQMNPHFIFNCLNSIKALIQNNENQRSIDYLTTFSKLIRTLFHNSDKRQISLYDELETCKLYTELEAMRLNGKLHYGFDIDHNLDLKSLMVPALIIQPFIENAIWHGIVPKNEGCVTISVKGFEDAIICEVDDDGIGRKLSKQNKPIVMATHESKGVHLSQARLNLEKLLNDTTASIKIIDKYDEQQPKGTKVIITFNLQES